MKKNQATYVLFGLVLILVACNKTKVIEEEKKGPETGIFSDDNSDHSMHQHEQQVENQELHQVLVQEVLYTTKYVYLFVEENGDKFWIATRKFDAVQGETYFYKGGLLKTDFHSKEHDRIFDKIYLVTNLVTEDHGQHSSKNTAPNSSPSALVQTSTKDKISILTLVQNQKNYEGKYVVITGKCVKLNAGIMDRNWIHLQDGSNDEYDLVVTSNTVVDVGKIVTIKALVTINKDFGSGYNYDLILEDGIVLSEE